MKYKVIGWTNYENYDILDSKNTIGFAESNAIIAEIRNINIYLVDGIIKSGMIVVFQF